MIFMPVKVKLDEGAFAPERAHLLDAGADIRTPYGFYLCSGESIVVDTGVHVQIPHGYVGMLKSKSGLNVMHSITSEGVIDAGYTGSIRVKLYNNGAGKEFLPGDKISQLVIMPCILCDFTVVDNLEATDRGNNGFGSTGR